MSNITWQFQASIPNGPSFTLNTPVIAVQAFDSASATIVKGATNVPVIVQPSSSAGDVVFVAVWSDVYGAGLTYTIDGSGTAHPLDAPHVMLGAGAVGMMNGGAPPQKLVFSSTLTQDANIKVVAGRVSP
jgi:hypothetical protein